MNELSWKLIMNAGSNHESAMFQQGGQDFNKKKKIKEKTGRENKNKTL